MSDLADMPADQLQAVVLAGGRGTRLSAVVGDRPKVLAEVTGRPFLHWVLLGLYRAGLRRIVVCTGYMASSVEAYVGGGEAWGLAAVHSREAHPLGTAGALRGALDLIDSDPVLVLNGDSWCQCDLAALFAAHGRKTAAATLVLSQAADTSRFGRVALGPDGSIQKFIEKQASGGPGWISAGIYLFGRNTIRSIPLGQSTSLERDIFPGLAGLNLFGYPSSGPFVDIGTPESYRESQEFFAAAEWQDEV